MWWKSFFGLVCIARPICMIITTCKYIKSSKEGICKGQLKNLRVSFYFLRSTCSMSPFIFQHTAMSCFTFNTQIMIVMIHFVTPTTMSWNNCWSHCQHEWVILWFVFLLAHFSRNIKKIYPQIETVPKHINLNYAEEMQLHRNLNEQGNKSRDQHIQVVETRDSGIPRIKTMDG